MSRERAYTVSEINDLRQAVENKYLYGAYRGARFVGHNPQTYFEPRKTTIVEEQVRTHMLAGHTAEDLLATEPELPIDMPIDMPHTPRGQIKLRHLICSDEAEALLQKMAAHYPVEFDGKSYLVIEAIEGEGSDVEFTLSQVDPASFRGLEGFTPAT